MGIAALLRETCSGHSPLLLGEIHSGRRPLLLGKYIVDIAMNLDSEVRIRGPRPWEM